MTTQAPAASTTRENVRRATSRTTVLWSIRGRPGLQACLTFAGIALVVNAVAFIRTGVPVNGDLTYPWHIDRYFANYRYLFNDSGTVSNLESVDRAALLLPLSYVAKVLGLGTLFVHRALFTGTLFLSFASMYMLLRHFLGRSFPRFARNSVMIPACLVYGLSPWVIEQIQAYLFWFAYALTPLLILLVLRLVDRPGLRTAAGLAVVMTFVSLTPQYFVYSCAVIGLLIVGLALTGAIAGDQLGRLAAGLAAAASIFVFLNLSWIYPVAELLASGRQISPGYEVTADMTRMFSANSTPLNVLRGYDQWIAWYQNDSRMSFVFNRLWVANTLLIPALAVTVYLSRDVRRDRVLRVVTLVVIPFTLLSLGTHTPLYDWLVFSAPGSTFFGWVFRVPGKLSYMLWVWYALLFAVALGKLLSCQLRRPLKGALVAGLALSSAVALLPKVSLYFADYYAPIAQPNEYAALDRFLADQPGDYRVLYMAPYDGSFALNRLGFETSFTWNESRLTAATPVLSSQKPSIGFYHLTYRPWQEPLFGRLSEGIPPRVGEDILREIGVRFVVYHADIVAGEGRAALELDRLRASDLEERATFGFVHVFENPTYQSVVRSSAGGLRVSRRDPTRYSLEFGRSGGQDVLMGQPFDPLWVLRIGDDVIAPVKDGPLGMKFVVPPGKARSASLEYYPQRYYERGLLLSALFGLLVLFGAVFGPKARAAVGPRRGRGPEDIGGDPK